MIEEKRIQVGERFLVPEAGGWVLAEITKLGVLDSDERVDPRDSVDQATHVEISCAAQGSRKHPIEVYKKLAEPLPPVQAPITSF